MPLILVAFYDIHGRKREVLFIPEGIAETPSGIKSEWYIMYVMSQ
jgi:hypothetical protein